ncbi:MAG: ABC transporter permease [Thermoproteota archaeon]
MITYILRRLAQAVPVVLVVSAVVFFLLRLIPGDPALVIAGPDAGPEQVAAVRHDLGLDQPLPNQYAIWLSRAISGDLGKSYITRRPVAELIGRAMPATIQLVFAGILIALFLGIPLGVAAGLRPYQFWDTVLAIMAALTLGVPNFLLGIIYLLIFSLLLGLLPPGGRVDPSVDFPAGLKSLILPAITLGLPTASVFARFVRIELLNAMRQDYIRTAHSKGLSNNTVAYRHALPNALLPLATIVGVQLARLLGGTLVIEQVFTWPGMGRLALQAVQTRDYMLFQGIVLLLAISAVLINLLADLTYGFLDPRIRGAR